MKKIIIIIFTLFPVLSLSQNWISVGSGVDGSITTMVVDTSANILYIGGQFTTIDGDTVHQVAGYDGNNFFPLGNGLGGQFESVWQLIMYNGKLIACGHLGVPGITCIAQWDGNSWTQFGDTTLNVYDFLTIAVYNGELYAGGQWSGLNGHIINYITKFNGNDWVTVGGGMNNYVTSLYVYNNELYAGGWFTQCGGVSANHIAKWNGLTWQPLGLGVDSGPQQPRVHTILNYHDTLYCGGWFTSAGGQSANNIASWDGTNWHSVGNGMNACVSSIVSYNNTIIAGGLFSNADNNHVGYIARWDNNGWHSIDQGMNGSINALCVYNNELYAGGGFTIAGSSSCMGLVKISNINQLSNISSEPFNISLFPNPSQDKIRIKINNKNNKKIKVKIYDQLGNLIISKDKYSSEFTLERDNLKSGIYFLSLIDEDNELNVMKKIIFY